MARCWPQQREQARLIVEATELEAKVKSAVWSEIAHQAAAIEAEEARQMNLAVIALQRAVRSWIQQKWDRKLSQQDRQVDNDLLHGEDPENTGEEVAEGKDIPSTDMETTDGGGQMQPSGLERPAAASASAIMPTFLSSLDRNPRSFGWCLLAGCVGAEKCYKDNDRWRQCIIFEPGDSAQERERDTGAKENEDDSSGDELSGRLLAIAPAGTLEQIDAQHLRNPGAIPLGPALVIVAAPGCRRQRAAQNQR